MGELTCSTRRCKNKVEYHNSNEDSYYCESCAYTFFTSEECSKIGSITITKQMIRLNRNLLEKIRSYVKDEELAKKWSQALEQLEIFDIELKEIEDKLEDTLKSGKLRDLNSIEERSFKLKFKITESEAYRKFLLHRDMNEFRLKDEEADINSTLVQIVKDMTEIRVEEQKALMEERLRNWQNRYESKHSINYELEEFKKMHNEEIETIKQQLLSNKEAYEKEKEEWEAQRIEIEQELNEFKSKYIPDDKPEDISEDLPSLSYDDLNVLYKDTIGSSVVLNLSSSMNLKLNEEKWINFIKILSKFKLPPISYYSLDNVPYDSEEVRVFIRNSIPINKNFYFNFNKQVQIIGSKYLKELKIAAMNTTEHFNIYYTNLTAKEFCEIISAGKNCTHLYFCYNSISFDEEVYFEGDMSECKIELLDFNYSGSDSYSDWNKNPKRFENMISAISKCVPLSKSLKKIDVSNCSLTKDKAEEVMKKYNLSEIKITTV